ncbi:SMC family ATPase [Schaalia sp. HMT-877]|nr:SMC family ATPase [Schaalia sp. HMT-877]
MRIRRLEMVGIGPFTQRQVIDFTAFDESGLFLLEGPTGSGKSTIIDALTFALYGDVARQKDASKDRLRSNRLEDGQRSEVDLVFEVRSGLYRVARTPAYTPAGRKTQRNSKATLVRVVEDPSAEAGVRTVEDIASGPSKVGPEITRIVGLDKEQFLQTIVLPQGKFARFLTATSDERERILRDIFDTRVYVAFQERLAEAAASSRAALAERERAAAGAMARVAGVAVPGVALDAAEGGGDRGAGAPAGTGQEGAGAPGGSSRGAAAPGGAARGADSGPAAAPGPTSADPDPCAEDPAPALEWARGRHRLVEEALEGARLAAAEADARDSEQQEELRRALDDLAAVERHRRLVEQLAGLEDAQPGIDELRARCRSGRAAQRVLAYADAHERAVRAREAARLLVARRWREAGGDGEPPASSAEASASCPLWREAARAASQRAAALEGLAAVEAALPGRVQRVAALEADEASAAERLRACEEAARVLPSQIERAQAGLEAMRADAAAVPAARAELERLDDRLEASRRADVLRASLTGLSEALREAVRGAKVADAAARDAHDLWLSATAGALAAGLADGSPCPVCGSESHPSPAPLSEDGITREQVRGLDEARQRADGELADAKSAHSDAVREISRLNAIAGDHTGAIEELRGAAASRLRALEGAARRIPGVEEAIGQERARLGELEGRRADAAASLARARAALDEERAALERARGQVAEHAPGGRTIAESIEESEALASAFSALLEAASTWSGACEQEESARAEFVAQLGRSGLPSDGDSWRGALVDEDLLDSYEARVSGHGQQLFALRQALASQEMERAGGLDAPDVEGARERARASARARVAAHQRVGSLEQCARELGSAVESLASCVDELRAARQEAGPVRRLADIAAASSPENLAATPLSAWVLVSRLEEVLRATNPRLAAISSGRYELVAVPDDGTQSRKSGLGLRIVDHDTDTERSARTLSGGETFYTSLALALGLADVVTAEAGGVELRTVFIDEGFGSLDAHTLSLVMDQLHQLRDGGRCVGVVSHVEEMASQIPDQVRVRPLPAGGSSLRVRA